jgi:hypothetical protein
VRIHPVWPGSALLNYVDNKIAVRAGVEDEFPIVGVDSFHCVASRCDATNRSYSRHGRVSLAGVA